MNTKKKRSRRQIVHHILLFFKGFIYLFLERGAGRKRGRETFMGYLLGTKPTTQACALTGN